jgi:hypothetical protein
MLDAAAAAAVCRELSMWHLEPSRRLFGGRLRPVVLALVEMKTLGRWMPRGRRIELSVGFVARARWGEIVEVLKHEMAHQYVSEVLGVTDETAHGPTFRRVCEELGIDGRPSGAPVEGDAKASKVLERIRKLLALADSPEEHEARAAMKAAQRLMLAHNVELVSRHETPDYRWAEVGAVRARVPKHERILAGILARHFFVQSIWVTAYDVHRGRRGQVLEVCGTPWNVEIASYVHDYVLGTGEQLWASHKRTHGIRGDRDRRRFLEGLMIGYAEQLEGQVQEVAETGLVWTGDAALEQWVGRRHRRLRKGRRLGVVDHEATSAGRQVGRKLVVRKGISHESTGRGRQLERKG